MSSTLQSPVIGPYEIQEEWKRDAFSITYVGRHLKKHSKASLVQVLSPEICNRENFIVRFDLIKTILPKISHPNLLHVEEMGNHQNLYYIGKALPSTLSDSLVSYEDFSLQDIPRRFLALAKILHGISEGLNALQNLSISYYRNGIDFLNLSPENIFLAPKPSSLHSWDRVPLLDHYVDPFLFFGDGPSALASYHMHRASFKKGRKDLFSHFSQSPHAVSPKGGIAHKEVQAAFAGLIYLKLAHTLPVGPLRSLRELDPLCPDFFEKLVKQLFEAPYDKGFSSFSQISHLLEDFIRKQASPSKKEQYLQAITPPENMSLIVLQEKAILGAQEGPANETPSFKAKIRPFFIARTPVTNLEFQKFQPNYQRSTYSKEDNAPATLITLEEALAYCDYRSKKEGLPLGTYRLPTEYEWEACARGSTGEQYPWGAYYQENKMHCGRPPAEGTVPVDSFSPGRFFVSGLLGNVWEWTSSTYSPHPFSQDSSSKYSPKLQVVKGGCWFTPLDSCRASLRTAFPPFIKKGHIGFRIARSLPEEFNEDSKAQ